MIKITPEIIPALREAAKGQTCVRCGISDGTIVGCHYTGVRRGAYGGGMSIKCHDLVVAHLCARCHKWMDQLSRDKEDRWLHSEEFQHCVLMTVIRLFTQGFLQLGKGTVD